MGSGFIRSGHSLCVLSFDGTAQLNRPR